MSGQIFKQVKKVQKGFTLVELMIVVSIIIILASIAMPAYSNYVKQARIAEATAALSDYRVKLEQFYLDNRTYAGFTCPLSAITTPKEFGIACSPTATASSYTVVATGTGSMAGFSYSINQANTKSTVALPTGWGSSTTSCWIKSKGASC